MNGLESKDNCWQMQWIITERYKMLTGHGLEEGTEESVNASVRWWVVVFLRCFVPILVWVLLFFCTTKAALRGSANRIISFKQDLDVICTYAVMVYEDVLCYCTQIKINDLVVVANMCLSGSYMFKWKLSKVWWTKSQLTLGSEWFGRGNVGFSQSEASLVVMVAADWLSASSWGPGPPLSHHSAFLWLRMCVMDSVCNS